MKITNKLKIPQKACNKCKFGVMDLDNPHLWNECLCKCHEFNGKDVCEDPEKYGYETALNNKPFNCLYDCFSLEYFCYEQGYTQGVLERKSK